MAESWQCGDKCDIEIDVERADTHIGDYIKAVIQAKLSLPHGGVPEADGGDDDRQECERVDDDDDGRACVFICRMI